MSPAHGGLAARLRSPCGRHRTDSGVLTAWPRLVLLCPLAACHPELATRPHRDHPGPACTPPGSLTGREGVLPYEPLRRGLVGGMEGGGLSLPQPPPPPPPPPCLTVPQERPAALGHIPGNPVPPHV